MPLQTAPERPPVRHSQALSFSELRSEAASAFEASGLTQTQLADRLGSSQALISKAFRDETGRYAVTLGRIIEDLTDYSVSEETTTVYRVFRKSSR